MKRKNPPIIVLVVGTSLIPNNGSQTQKIPPITSVKDNKVNSAAGIALDPIEYKIKPIQTNVPCKENEKKILIEKAKQTEIYKNFMENFPDAELVDVKSISKEDKDNDWF